MHGLPVAAAQPGGRRGVIEPAAQPEGGQPAAPLGEQEVGGPVQPGMRQRPLRAAAGHPLIQRGQGGLIQRHGPFGGELAKGDLQPAAVAGRIPDAVQLQVEQLAEPDAGAAQHGQPGAGERVGKLADGGHQVPVGIRWQGAGQRFVQPGNVGGEQQPPGRSLGPAPQGQVAEETAQVDDGPLADCRGDGLVAGEAAAPGPLVVPAQESLDVLAVQLGQAADARMGGGQVLGEHDQAVSAQTDRVGPQRGRHGGQVAQRGRADAGLADRLHPLGDARLTGPGLPRRVLADPQLIAGLVQAEDAGGVVHPGITACRGRLGQSLGEGREIIIAQLGEGLARGHADQGQGAAGHIPGPVRAPPEPLRYFGDLLHVAGMPGGPLQVKVTGGLGEQQIQVGREVAFDETPGQERPCAGALEVGQPRRGRPPHPGRQLRMGGQQPRGGVAPDPPAVRADRQRSDRVGIGDQQVGRPLTAQRDGGRGAHRAAARARAYSAASVSGDRCT